MKDITEYVSDDILIEKEDNLSVISEMQNPDEINDEELKCDEPEDCYDNKNLKEDENKNHKELTYYDGVHGIDTDEFLYQIFKFFYRFKQRSSALCWGFAEGMFTGGVIGGKWGGSGGWITGAIGQLLGVFWGATFGAILLPMMGFMSDRYIIAQLAKDYRYAFGAGGTPPTHGMWS